MPIAYKEVKGAQYVYFNYWDPDQRKKIEIYCGAVADPAAMEKAQTLESEFLQKEINNLQLKLRDTGTSKRPKKRKPKSVRQSMQDNIEMQEYLKNATIYDPDVYYGTSEHMDEIENESVQMIVTSPPYNVGKEYVAYDDKKELRVYLDFLSSIWLECRRKLCKGGRIAINMADTWRTPYIPLHCHITKSLIDLGFLMRGIIYWDKGASVGISTAWGSWRSASNPCLRDVGEYILVFSKDNFKLETDNKVSTITAEQFTAYTKSLWTFPTAQSADSSHPAPFPDELPKRLILLYTFLGDTVLDPFLGSGTTCKVAKGLGRKSIGYEIDDSYKSEIESKIRSVKSIGLSLDSFTANGKRPTQKLPAIPMALRSAMKESS